MKPTDVNLETFLTKNTSPDSITEAVDKRFPNWLVIAHDIENRGEPSREGLLLSAFYYSNEVLVIDNTSVDNHEVFTPTILKRCMFIAHNADHEAQWGTVTNFLPGRYMCTLVTGKRLTSGMEGLRHDIISEINRYLGNDAVPIEMNKDIRSTFATCTFFTDEHILYNAADTLKLKALLEAQLQQAEVLKQEFLMNSLCSRIIKPIAYTEVTGIKHNTEKWLTIAKDRKEKADKLCEELSNTAFSILGENMEQVNPQIKKKREQKEKQQQKLLARKEKLEVAIRKLEEVQKTHLKSYQVQKDQLTTLIASITQHQENTHAGLGVGVINWGSQKQVLKCFELIGIPLPEGKDKKTKQLKPSTDKEARASWFTTYEGYAFEPIMKTFDKFKKIEHNIKSFGQKWVNQYVKNGRIFPAFDQAGTDTGRWTSGSKGVKNKTKPNTSQIPAREGAEYRQCFEADEERLFVTADWKNQEGVLIISLSGDMEMKKITEVADQHSLLGTRAWRAVYAHRYAKTKKEEWKVLAETYEMNKKTPEGEKARNKFKNSAGLFPCLYGAQAYKVAVTSQVTVEEAQIMIDVIKSHAPVASKFLDEARLQASSKGYVVHNSRTNSRRWFQAVLDQLHYGYTLNKSTKVEIELAGGNTKIQGTGSDLLKEAMAMIDLWNTLYKQDIRFVLSNYDELVYSIPVSKKEQYMKVIEEFMKRAAKNYLILGVDMECDIKVAPHWDK